MSPEMFTIAKWAVFFFIIIVASRNFGTILGAYFGMKHKVLEQGYELPDVSINGTPWVILKVRVTVLCTMWFVTFAVAAAGILI